MNAKRIILFIVAALVIGLLFYLFSPENEDRPVMKREIVEPAFRKDGNLTFLGEEGDTLQVIAIEVADDQDEITQGLMYRKAMADTLGMLFIFPNQQPRTFWMKNTFIPLDIIYVNNNYEIVAIRENNPPLSERSIPSDAPARYVVEVIGGFAARHDIEEGDRIQFELKN